MLKGFTWKSSLIKISRWSSFTDPFQTLVTLYCESTKVFQGRKTSLLLLRYTSKLWNSWALLKHCLRRARDDWAQKKKTAQTITRAFWEGRVIRVRVLYYMFNVRELATCNSVYKSYRLNNTAKWIDSSTGVGATGTFQFLLEFSRTKSFLTALNRM